MFCLCFWDIGTKHSYINLPLNLEKNLDYYLPWGGQKVLGWRSKHFRGSFGPLPCFELPQNLAACPLQDMVGGLWSPYALIWPKDTPWSTLWVYPRAKSLCVGRSLGAFTLDLYWPIGENRCFWSHKLRFMWSKQRFLAYWHGLSGYAYHFN